MSVIDKVIAAVTPPESEEARTEARAKAKAAAKGNDWLKMILDHHVRIEAAFAAVRSASTASTRTTAQKVLGLLLTGHAIAEESVIYPALALNSHKVHASAGYTEQAAVKIQMAALEKLDPMSQDYLDKLGHIEGAVKHHVYEEEGNWFLDLKKDASDEDQKLLTQRYQEEFERYVGKQNI